MRLFIAVDIPINQKIIDLIEQINQSGADVKSVELENLHLTLLFIGEKRENELEGIEQSMNKVRFNEINALAQGIGFFPNEERPRVMWIGIRDQGEFRKVREQLVKELRMRKIYFEDRNEFSPHLTLCRIRSGRGVDKLREIGKSKKDEVFEDFKVKEVKLFKSTLTPKGPIYEQLYSIRSEG
ncbi:RNA 2',3'-cyclic phosphodiesterase [Sulfuracidifex tepidarius]|uniref:RNA 2',3'-cyclic phosphodiesterase n=1 Tax=Sulfuracidifex tepidarius TaxID=1294262 RepID=A0A510E1F6_9CREN|nr:RNA 2',3'-cyclic phosphodiesterase [Sulfuracidifex tepidarius]BBG23579.1 RNA 2',3'-cyclic phosphodiesterase [Sulfuracidifex tepidarius]BBG26326.1 RNA 2',3'-cyclic phosphodiesterase [Sulfuracidifex tepidarius]